MRIFVTGGTGFIGKHVVEELKKDKDNELFLLLKDLADIRSWKKEVEYFKPDSVVHLAWEGLPDHGLKISVKNLRYGLDVMEMVDAIGCKTFISTGSCFEYGLRSGKVSEDMAIAPLNSFTAAKNCLCQLGQKYAEENGMRFMWARPFYVYGPGQREGSLLPHVIRSVHAGKVPEIKNPLGENDFVYVGDVANALCLLLKKCQKSGIYNIGSGKLTSVSEIIEIACKQMGRPNTSRAVQADISPSGFFADISKMKKETGWEPEVGIQEGIQRTIRYYTT